MDKINYTPGPWEFVIGDGYSKTDWVIQQQEPQYPQVIIRNEPRTFSDDPEFLANYRLMAAAPELLEACQKMIAYRDSYGPLNFQLEKADDFIRLMRIAVEKATRSR